MSLNPRMIQNFTSATNTTYYWGYGERLVPCTSDAGACAYLDVVYDSHVASMLYAGIFWAVIGGGLLLWGLARCFVPAATRATVSGLAVSTTSLEAEGQENRAKHNRGVASRLAAALGSTRRKYLLPRAPLRAVFGPTTRLQVLILAVLAAYLAVFTLAGMVYGRWYSPVKSAPAGTYNTRTTLGPFADRIGVWAYALTPLSVLLASRESLLSLITGIPYTSFMFLHRWTGHIILFQSIVHTLGWVVVEARLYQPQPKVWNTLMANLYVQWGFAALGVLVLLWVLSLKWTVRHVTGYEVFRKTHYVLAAVYMGAAIAHWQLLQCFLVPGLVLWFADRLARGVRAFLLHYRRQDSQGGSVWGGFEAAQATARLWRDDKYGDVYRLDFDHLQRPWHVGQHFFLTFPEGSVWQSHPMTPCSVPLAGRDGMVRHTYVVRAQRGETRRIAGVLREKLAAGGSGGQVAGTVTTPVVLQGPYGEDILCGLEPDANVLCVAGGTGVTYILPVLLRLGMEKWDKAGRTVELVWAVKRASDVQWVREEVQQVRAAGVRVRVFVTEEEGEEKAASSKSSSNSGSVSASKETDVHVATTPLREAGPSSELEWATGRPDVRAVVGDFVQATATGPTTVFGSGPHGMIVDLRSAVARCNSGRRVWRGEERWDVTLLCDER